MAVGRTVAVILAAGRGVRLGGGVPSKVLLPLAGESILVRATRPFAEHSAIDEVIVVAAAEEMGSCAEELRRARMGDVMVIPGGATRHASESLAVGGLAPRIERDEIELIAIHDAARPLYRGERLEELLAAARDTGGAILALPVDPADHLARIEDRGPPTPVPTEGLWRAQTPQAFRGEVLLEAFLQAEKEGREGSDTSSTVERSGVSVRVVLGEPDNIKITFPEDLSVAESLLAARGEPD
ncbi:MAG: IspD/TarI family cytidylyltransferase [Actinomycetota bacterium]